MTRMLAGMPIFVAMKIRERIDFVSIIMAKELIRVPRVLGEML